MEQPGSRRATQGQPQRPPPAPRARVRAWLGRPPTRLIGQLLLAAILLMLCVGPWVIAYRTLDAVFGRNGQANEGTPRQVPGLRGVTAIAAGGGHGLALGEDGAVWAWGDNAYGQLGIGTTRSQPQPQRVPLARPATAVAASRSASFAVTDDGKVWSWGENFLGELGTNDVSPVCGYSPGPKHRAYAVSPVQLAGLSGVKALAANNHRVLALTTSGAVWGWGWNEDGELGDGGETCGDSGRVHHRTPARIPVPQAAKAVALGLVHSLVLMEDGRVWARGSTGCGAAGRVGQPIVAGLSDVRAIAAGPQSSMAIRSDGSVAFWGAGVGSGTCAVYSVHAKGMITVPYTGSPIALTGLPPAATMTEGWSIAADGQLWSWKPGISSSPGGATGASVSAQPHGLGKVRALVQYQFSARVLALRDDGTVWGWTMPE